MSTEKPIELDLEKLKKRRITITGMTAGLLLAAGSGTWLGHAWLRDHVTDKLDLVFQNEAQAQTLGQQVREATNAARDAASAAESVGRSLASYIKRQDAKEARERLSVLKQQLGETQLWESANGVNDITRARKADLTAQIEATQAYIACLDSGRTDCAL